MPKTHFSITQAGLISGFTAAVGQVIALVPAWAPEKADLLQGGSFLIAGGFLAANAIHKLADSNVSPRDVEQNAIDLAKTEVAKLDLPALAASAVNDAVTASSPGDLEVKAIAAARSEVKTMLASIVQPPERSVVLAGPAEPAAAPPQAVPGGAATPLTPGQ